MIVINHFTDYLEITNKNINDIVNTVNIDDNKQQENCILLIL